MTVIFRRPKGLNRRAPAAASLHGPWLRCPPEPRPASSAQGRPFIVIEATTCRQASVLGWVATCSFDRRLGRVCRCASRRMSMCASRQKPSAAEKSASFPHAMLHAPVRLNLDLALPNGRNAPGRMPATKRPAWYPTAHSCATSDTNESLHPEIELQHVAIHQPSNQSARNETTTAGMPQRKQTSSNPWIGGIKHDFQRIGSASPPSP